jgi:hypothetical protein
MSGIEQASSREVVLSMPMGFQDDDRAPAIRLVC